MHDVVSLDQERLRRAGSFAVRPHVFRKIAEPQPLSDARDLGASPATVRLALPPPPASDQDPSDEVRAAAELVEPSSAPVDNLKKPNREDRPATINFVRRIANGSAQRATAWSKTFALRCMGWMPFRSRRVDELAGLMEEAKYRTLSNRLNTISVLEPREQEAVQNVSGAVRRTYQSGSDLVRQGEVTPRPMFIVSGWACRVRVLPGGSRQIIGFLLPGDGVGLRGCGEPLSVTTITALTTLETVDGAALLTMAAHPSRFSGVSHAVGRASVQDEEFLVNQIVRLTLPSPAARLAHLMLELQWRLAQAGLATEREFSMPLSYDTLSQAMGVTASVAARAMRKLRRGRIIRFRYGRAFLSRPDLMRQMSGFSAPGSCTCGRMTMTPA